MMEADRRHGIYCFGVLRAALGLCAMPGDDELPGECVRLFVSWHLVTDGARRLRGCIGTFEPQPLAQGLRAYAIRSACHDRRFPPICAAELERLECTVSLLTPMEVCADWLDWDLGVHGVYVCLEGGASVTFLPEIAPAQGWTKAETIERVIRKAGWTAPITDTLLRHATLQRYTSTQATVTYDEYMLYTR